MQPIEEPCVCTLLFILEDELLLLLLLLLLCVGGFLGCVYQKRSLLCVKIVTVVDPFPHCKW